MSWFKKKQKFTKLSGYSKKKDLPEGVWTKCDSCQEYVTNEEIRRNLYRCPHCDHYSVFPVQDRLESIVDPDTFEEFDARLCSKNPLDFNGYDKKLQSAQKKTGRSEGCLAGFGKIHNKPVILAVLDFSFMGGSMGSVVGEKITRAAERALNDEIPLVTISTGGGGARMQEGTLSLMQMAKTSAAVGLLRKQGIPFISIIAHPTMGGVAASYAALGDIIITEPRALVGFTGPRVIEQTIGQQLPEGFQRSEFLLEHGQVDMIVDRDKLRDVLRPILQHTWSAQMAKRQTRQTEGNVALKAVKS